MTVRSLLLRGMLAGLLAGMLALAFAEVFGEPQVDRAITFEQQEARLNHEALGPQLVSRDVQKSAGLAVAVALYATAFGGLFALAFAVAYGRIGRFGPRACAALLAGGGFVAIVLAPFLKYPANPPAIGNPATIDRRTALYFLVLGCSLLAAIGAVVLGRRLLPRAGAWNAAVLAAAAFVVTIAIVQLALPTVDEVPPGFPASALWRFRLASLGTQLVLWTAMGLLFGALTERSLRRSLRAGSASRPGVRASPAAPSRTQPAGD
ncbi:MAG TPA: CbtA family protein [Dehalococcoidia bacterium]|nr:CbtA family protein [Dehalococcoidia bacterium]